MLEIKALDKKFGKLEVLKNIDFRMIPGLTTAVLGPNGSGKTTLIKCILGQVFPDAGDIRFKGSSIIREWKYRKEIGYLPQLTSFPENLKVVELIRMITDIRGKAACMNRVADLFDLEPHTGKKVKNLSGGTRQKVNLLLTFMFDCPLYILDEPTAGLDPVTMIRFKEYLKFLKDEGKTILLTTHIMDLVSEIADQVIFLLEGSVYFQGTPGELLNFSGEYDLEHAIARLMQKNDVENIKVQPV